MITLTEEERETLSQVFYDAIWMNWECCEDGADVSLEDFQQHARKVLALASKMEVKVEDLGPLMKKIEPLNEKEY